MASRASVYTNSCKSGNPANAGFPLRLLVEIFPQAPKTHIAGRYGSAPSVLHVGRSTLVLLFSFLRLRLLRCKIRAQILPMNQKLLELPLFLTVCGIKRFFSASTWLYAASSVFCAKSAGPTPTAGSRRPTSCGARSIRNADFAIPSFQTGKSVR